MQKLNHRDANADQWVTALAQLANSLAKKTTHFFVRCDKINVKKLMLIIHLQQKCCQIKDCFDIQFLHKFKGR
jgi:hypothetical protein